MIRHLTLSALFLCGTGVLPAEDQAATPAPAAATKIERLTPELWCWIHDLPKNTCVTCDRKLIPALKKAKDWCAEHNCAESVCLLCDPKAKERLDALRPSEKPAPAPAP